MKNYDIVSYWNERNNPCSNTIDKLTDTHLTYLTRNTMGCELMLDFGPGYGRMFPAYKYTKKLIGVDVTNQHKESLKQEAGKAGFEFELICKTDDFSKLNFPDKYFDTVVTSEVLFHLTPNIIEPVMRELNRISQKVVVISYMNLNEQYEAINKYIPDKRYCFNYDYYEICKRNNWLIRNEERIRNQLMFVYSDYFSFQYKKHKIKFLFDRDEYYMSRIIKSTKNFYEIKYLEYLKDNILNTDSEIVEVGAYLGNHSVYFSKIIGCKRICCIEPTPYSFSILKDNLTMNMSNKSNILTLQMAISDNEENVRVVKSNPDNPGANQYGKGGDTNCSPLDSVYLGKVDFIKIDVENSEMKVLNGASNIINKQRPFIMIEVGKNNILNVNEWIQKNKYKRIALDVFNKNTWLLKG